MRPYPIGAAPQQQTAVSQSTPESDIVALEQVLHTLAIPADALWTQVLGRPMRPCLKDDNAACRMAAQTGNNPQMIHVERTHHVDIRWVYDKYRRTHYLLGKG